MNHEASCLLLVRLVCLLIVVWGLTLRIELRAALTFLFSAGFSAKGSA